jgi:hypothetical protein
MRASTKFLPAVPDFRRFGLNAAWSLRQGGFIVPRAIIEQPCAVCGEKKKKIRLERPGDLFGRRLCKTHGLASQRQELACGVTDPEATRKPTSLAEAQNRHAISAPRLIAAKKAGKPAISVEEDAKNYGGCALCKAPEWGSVVVWHAGGRQYLGSRKLGSKPNLESRSY